MYQEQGETIDDMAHKCNFKVICVAAAAEGVAVVHDLVDDLYEIDSSWLDYSIKPSEQD